MKRLDRCQPTKDKARENFLNGLADPIPRPSGPWIPDYTYDEGLGKMTFFVQKALLPPMLKHLRAKNLEAWSCFSNGVLGEIIVEATPEASEQALGDFFGKLRPQPSF